MLGATEILIVGFTLGAIILAVVVYGRATEGSRKQLAAALQAYQKSLESLKADPNNPELRQQALQLGRTYANLTRDKKGVTAFDELALRNDIDAVCAGR